MLSPDHERLVESYIAARTWIEGADGVLRRVDESDWASGALFDAVWEDAAVGWSLIREITRRTQNDGILEELANGALHALLVDHSEIMPVIEADANTDAQLRALLSAFYDDNALSAELMARVLRARHPQH